MTIKETAHELNKMFKEESEIELIDKIKMLEDKLELMMKVIENMANRIDYLEARQ